MQATLWWCPPLPLHLWVRYEMFVIWEDEVPTLPRITWFLGVTAHTPRAFGIAPRWHLSLVRRQFSPEVHYLGCNGLLVNPTITIYHLVLKNPVVIWTLVGYTCC